MQGFTVKFERMLAALSLAALCGLAPAHAGERQLLIYDDDWTAAAATALIPLLASPGIEVLGLTTVTGDVWRDQGRQELLGFLDVVGASVPVVDGALMPLSNTREQMLAWETRYGKIPWKGAWNEASGPQPTALGTGEDAAAFIIRQVRAHPYQVTVYAGGPLTNVALALRRDPDVAALARALVFTGGNLAQIKANGTVKSDFNFLFDPEAAALVLQAPWRSITSLGDAADGAVITPALHQRLLQQPTAAARYMVAHNPAGSTQWGLLGAALIAHPALVTATLEVRMAVDLDHGMFNGRARAWLPANAPPDTSAAVKVVRDVDVARFFEEVVKAAHSSTNTWGHAAKPLTQQ